MAGGTSGGGGVLDGVRVLELSQLIAAPFCGLTLVDLGADVVKIEPPEGDYTRTLEPELAPGRSAYFQMLNRGKRSVALDLRADGAGALVRALVDRADVVIEGLGGSGDAAGVSHEQASAHNPKLVWCSITGLGHGRGGRAIDPSLQAAMGMMALTGEPDRPPMRLPVPLVDYMTGMYAVQAVLAALIRVGRGEPGALLDCAMVDAAATLASSTGVYALSGAEPLRRMGSENRWYVPAANFEAADGEWVQLMAISEHHWRVLCRVLGHPEWIDEFAGNESRVAGRVRVHGLIAGAIGQRPAAEWEREITAAGGFCQRIREIEEAWSDPLISERGLLGFVDDVDLRGFPIPVASLAGRGRVALAPAPALGEHSRSVASEAGLADASIDELIASGALAAASGAAAAAD